jgi:hypothetical protein
MFIPAKEKREIFELLLKKPQFVSTLTWTDPRASGRGTHEWTKSDLELYEAMGGKIRKRSPSRSFPRSPRKGSPSRSRSRPRRSMGLPRLKSPSRKYWGQERHMKKLLPRECSRDSKLRMYFKYETGEPHKQTYEEFNVDSINDFVVKMRELRLSRDYWADFDEITEEDIQKMRKRLSSRLIPKNGIIFRKGLFVDVYGWTEDFFEVGFIKCV